MAPWGEGEALWQAPACRVFQRSAKKRMRRYDRQLTHPEPDPAPFKVHLLTRAGRVMRARSGPVRAFSTKDEAVRFAGRQLGGTYAVYHKDKKIWPNPA